MPIKKARRRYLFEIISRLRAIERILRGKLRIRNNTDEKEKIRPIRVYSRLFFRLLGRIPFFYGVAYFNSTNISRSCSVWRRARSVNEVQPTHLDVLCSFTCKIIKSQQYGEKELIGAKSFDAYYYLLTYGAKSSKNFWSCQLRQNVLRVCIPW